MSDYRQNLWDRLTVEGGDRALTPAAWVALVLISLAAMLPGFFSIPTMDRDEARYSQAARQMMETNDYVDIRFQDDPRHVKPAGVYWMQVATAAPFGGTDAPVWAHRLPSLFGALLAVLATAWLGARLFSAPVGVAAGIMLAMSLMLQVEARTAKTDAALLAAGVFAQLALMMLLVRGRELSGRFWGWPAVFWTATGAAVMIKGPIIAMVSALTAIGYALWMRDWRMLLRLQPLPGLALACAIFVPWIAAITIKTDGAFLMEAVGHALFGKVGEADDSHGGPLGYHTLLSPVTLWPAAALTGLAVLAAWKRRAEPEIRFLIAWIVPTWIVFELVQTKLPHYVLPTVPAIMLLMALGMTHAGGLLQSARAKALHTVTAVLAVIVAGVLGALAIAANQYLGEAIDAASWIAAGAGALALLAVAALAMKPSSGNRLLAASAGTIVVYGALFGGAVPRIDALWPSERAAQYADTLVGCERMQVITAGYREPSNVFHFGTDTVLARYGGEAARYLLSHSECGLAIVESRQSEAFFEALGDAAVRNLGAVEGHNTVKGDDITLTFYVLESSSIRRE
ncbi:MAG: glycosyltransferase family 39 protein [Pseudomonadota bacterium]